MVLATVPAPQASAERHPGSSHSFIYSYQLYQSFGAVYVSWSWPEYGGMIAKLVGNAGVSWFAKGPVPGTKSIGYLTPSGGLAAFALTSNDDLFSAHGSYLAVGTSCVSTPCVPKTCGGKKSELAEPGVQFVAVPGFSWVKVDFSPPMPDLMDCPAIPFIPPDRKMADAFRLSLFSVPRGGLVRLENKGTYVTEQANIPGGRSTTEWNWYVTLKRV